MDHEVMWRKCPARRNRAKAWEERQNRTRQPLARKKPLLSCYDSSPDVFGSFLLLGLLLRLGGVWKLQRVRFGSRQTPLLAPIF
jgi:hypothetical protein